jgi:hypothetical protein
MRSTLTRGTALALFPALGMLVLAGCGGSSDAGGSATPGSTPTSTSSTISIPTAPATQPKTSTPSNTTDPSRDLADVTLNVTLTGGKVNPSGVTVKAKAGQTVLITAVSDTRDELHVHGYDKELELQPGKPVSVTFKADIKGTFEVETHESGKLVAKLVVS